MTATDDYRQSSGTLASSQPVGVFELRVHQMYSKNPSGYALYMNIGSYGLSAC